MTLAALSVAVLTLMRSLVPEGEHSFMEPAAITAARYEAFAYDVADVALDEDPLPGLDVERTAYVVAVVAGRESFYRRAVMNCEQPGLGHAWGPLQLQGPRSLVCASWRQAIRHGLFMMRDSFARCAGLPLADRLSMWTDGRCVANWPRSRTRVLPALRWGLDSGGA